MTALIPIEGTGVAIMARGASISSGLTTFEQAENAIHILYRIGASAKWALADVLAKTEGSWGEQYAQALDATQMSLGTLRNIKHTWNHFPTMKSRKWDLSFSHYTAVSVSYLTDEQKSEILELAEAEGMNREQVRLIVAGYGPTIIKRQFDKEAFIYGLEQLIEWAESNDAPEDIIERINELFSEFKGE